MTIQLYELQSCPFCIRVREKLEELGVEYESHYVPAPHGQRTEVKELSGQTGVPVIVDPEHDVEGMYESRDIVAYLERVYGDDGN
jgi:glutathione S-transferase